MKQNRLETILLELQLIISTDEYRVHGNHPMEGYSEAKQTKSVADDHMMQEHRNNHTLKHTQCFHCGSALEYHSPNGVSHP